MIRLLTYGFPAGLAPPPVPIGTVAPLIWTASSEAKKIKV
jgi:hypothetical protein